MFCLAERVAVAFSEKQAALQYEGEEEHCLGAAKHAFAACPKYHCNIGILQVLDSGSPTIQLACSVDQGSLQAAMKMEQS